MRAQTEFSHALNNGIRAINLDGPKDGGILITAPMALIR